jgi:hypothetical protein
MGLGLAALGLWLASGCAAAPPEDAQARLAELQAEEERMEAALDSVEVRLLGNQSKLHLWEELGRRHRQVSAVQCQHANEHLQAMAQYFEQQEEKARQLRKRRRVATVDTKVLTMSQREPHRSN